VTVPIALLGILLVEIAQNAVNAALRQDNIEIATRARGEIEGYARFVEEQLLLTAVALERFETDSATLDPIQSSRFLNEALSSEVTAYFSDLYAVDTLAAIVATTNYAASDLPFEEAIAARAVLDTASFVTHAIDAPGEGESEEEMPAVVMATRLTSSFGELMGAVIAEVEMDSVWAVVNRIRVGENGQAFLVNQDGMVIAHRDVSLVYTPHNYSHLQSVQAALSDDGEGLPGQIPGFEQVTPEADQMMPAYAPIRAARLHWGLVIHRPRSEVWSTVTRMRLQIFTVVIIGIALAAVSTLVYTRRLVRPMGALVEGANRLSQGDLEHKIQVAGRDELGTLASEFNLMVEQLSQIQERLRRVEHLDTLAKFSSVVAHEIRNPLNAMQINLHLLQERVGSDELEYLDIISNEIKRLENLVREFQDISRPPVLSPEITNVNELVGEVVSLQKVTAGGQGIEILTILEPDLPEVQVDRNRIKQAVLNLVLNSMQSMPNGGRLELQTGNWEQVSGGIAIRIADTGEGIPREELSRVFDFYFTSRHSGSGLGLSVAQQVVDEHGGQITLLSAEGEGTTALIQLPPRPPTGSTPEFRPKV
jgi:signal transduction histidine kinase